MSDPGLPAPRPTAEQRERVMDLLSRSFAAGRIEMEDMEHRMEMAARAATQEELARAVVGLSSVPKDAPIRVPEPMGPDRPKGKSLSVAFMSGANRVGRWFPARRHVGVALMGGIRLDFRDAELEHGTTDVELWVMWGGVEIIVPPDLDVEVDGFAVMGGVRELAAHPRPLEAQTPKLRVRARVLMGGVDVKVRARGPVGEGDEGGDAGSRRRLRV